MRLVVVIILVAMAVATINKLADTMVADSEGHLPNYSKYDDSWD